MPPVKRSLISAISGWIAGSLAFGVAMGSADQVALQNWPGYSLIGAFYSAPVIFIVWLAALWPLYVRVPARSVLWHPTVCIGGGCAKGAALYYLLLRFIFCYPAYATTSYMHLAVGAAVGAVTCATGYLLKHREPNAA